MSKFFKVVLADVQGNVVGESLPHTTLYNQVDSTTAYLGSALPGTATSAASWQIQKLTFGGSGDVSVYYAGGSTAYTNIWDNRASLSYS